MPWKLKLDEESKLPAFQDPEKEGDLPRPIYINEEGKELALDPVGMYGKIVDMGKTEKELRGNTKRLEGQLELFTGIEDIVVWKEDADKALESIKNFNDKDWMDVKKVDNLKVEMKEAHDKKLNEVKESFQLKETEFSTTVGKKDVQIRKLMVSNKFATHPLFSGPKRKTRIPPEMAETFFGKHFKVEEDSQGELILRAYHTTGDPVYSTENPGELADFHEAMFSIFDKYDGKDDVMIGGESGSGSTGGPGDDDEGEGDQIQKLETQYAAAVEAKNVQMQIAIKNKLHALRIKMKVAA